MNLKLAAPLAGAMLLASCNEEPPPMPIQELMEKRVQPTAQAYWDTFQYVVDDAGERAIFPRTDAEWEKPRAAAEELGNLGELLLTDDYALGRGEDWKEFAQGLIDVSKQAELVINHKSEEEFYEVSGTIYNICSACHERYMPRPSATPGAVADDGAA